MAYHPNVNAILVKALKIHQAQIITNGRISINDRLKGAAKKPSTWIADNKCSNDLKQALSKENIIGQLVPPHNHRSNAAERTIQTFKYRFKACLVTVNSDFLLREWDQLLVQVKLTLTLLVNPKLLAYTYLFGQFDYNQTPLVPPGTKIIAHEKAQKRASWEIHGEQGWSIGPSLEHYLCIKWFFTKTRSKKNVDTVIFFPKAIKFPGLQLRNFLCQAAGDITTLLTSPP